MIRATGFSYNGLHIDSFDVTHISQGDGLQEESFLGNKSLETWSTNYSKKHYTKVIKKEPLVIPMALYFDGNLTFDKEQEIKEWLSQDEFCPLVFDDEPDVEYYAQIDGEVTLTHNTIDSGYIKFNFKTNSPYRFSNNIVFEGESKSNDTYTEVYVTSNSDMEIDTVITVTSPEVKDLEFWNEATGIRSILYGTYVNLSADFLSEFEEIDSRARFSPSLYDAHNGRFIRLVKGKNKIKIKGKCRFTIEYKNIYL